MRERANPKGYTLTVKEVDDTLEILKFEWRRTGEGKIAAFAEVWVAEDQIEYILSGMISEAAEDVYGQVYERIQSDVEDVISDLRKETPIYLSEIVVQSAENRGQGLGSELMQELESELKKNGIDTIYLQAVPSQRAAWYQRLGFSIVYPWDERYIEAHSLYPLLRKYI